MVKSTLYSGYAGKSHDDRVLFIGQDCSGFSVKSDEWNWNNGELLLNSLPLNLIQMENKTIILHNIKHCYTKTI